MELPLYFDYACPWAYLGSCRAEAYFRDLGVEIEFRPVHLARLKEASAGKAPELGPRKLANAANDKRHWAEAIGAEISPEAAALRATDTSLALRCALIAKDQGKFREFHYPAFRARWARARDLGQESVLEGLNGRLVALDFRLLQEPRAGSLEPMPGGVHREIRR